MNYIDLLQNLKQIHVNFTGTRVLSEPHTLLDAFYLHNSGKLDEEKYLLLNSLFLVKNTT